SLKESAVSRDVGVWVELLSEVQMLDRDVNRIATGDVEVWDGGIYGGVHDQDRLRPHDGTGVHPVLPDNRDLVPAGREHSAANVDRALRILRRVMEPVLYDICAVVEDRLPAREEQVLPEFGVAA